MRETMCGRSYAYTLIPPCRDSRATITADRRSGVARRAAEDWLDSTEMSCTPHWYTSCRGEGMLADFAHALATAPRLIASRVGNSAGAAFAESMSRVGIARWLAATMVAMLRQRGRPPRPKIGPVPMRSPPPGPAYGDHSQREVLGLDDIGYLAPGMSARFRRLQLDTLSLRGRVLIHGLAHILPARQRRSQHSGRRSGRDATSRRFDYLLIERIIHWKAPLCKRELALYDLSSLKVRQPSEPCPIRHGCFACSYDKHQYRKACWQLLRRKAR